MDIHAKDKYGCTPLEAASYNNQKEITQLLIKMLLIEKGVDTATKKSQDFLHIATQVGSLELVKALIQIKVDINARDDDGNTALHIAVENNQLEIVDFLVQKGASTVILNKGKLTPNQVAVAKGYSHLLKFFNKN